MTARLIAGASMVLLALTLAGCALVFPSSPTREQVQGAWTATSGDHRLRVLLSSTGAATATGVPRSALAGSGPNAPDRLDWTETEDLTGTWSYFEPVNGDPADIITTMTTVDGAEPASLSLKLGGSRLVLYYGYIEDGRELVFHRDAAQPLQPRVKLLRRSAFEGTWAAGPPDDPATIQLLDNGDMLVTRLPVDLLRSSGAPSVDWHSRVSFRGSWTWPEDPLASDSNVFITWTQRPDGAEFDASGLDVALNGATITLSMHSGLVAWNRHVEFVRTAAKD
jgi:hypothetical protein